MCEICCLFACSSSVIEETVTKIKKAAIKKSVKGLLSGISDAEKKDILSGL